MNLKSFKKNLLDCIRLLFCITMHSIICLCVHVDGICLFLINSQILWLQRASKNKAFCLDSAPPLIFKEPEQWLLSGLRSQQSNIAMEIHNDPQSWGDYKHSLNHKMQVSHLQVVLWIYHLINILWGLLVKDEKPATGMAFFPFWFQERVRGGNEALD